MGKPAEQGPKNQEMLPNLLSLQIARPRKNEIKLETQEHSVLGLENTDEDLEKIKEGGKNTTSSKSKEKATKSRHGAKGAQSSCECSWFAAVTLSH